MSGFAFSPQFSQRWLATSDSIKTAIINELDDIRTLLQRDTDIDTFQFRVNNLHDEVETIIVKERQAEAERIAKEQALQRLEQERLERERQAKLEQERREQEALQKQIEARLEAERLEKERLEQELLEKQAHIDNVKQDIIDSLSKKLDDYFDEKMDALRQEMQAWLTVEVDKQLQEKLQ